MHMTPRIETVVYQKLKCSDMLGHWLSNSWVAKTGLLKKMVYAGALLTFLSAFFFSRKTFTVHNE